MRKFIRLWQVIILDTLGVLLILISPLLGWLPGPGGLPIFLAGLGLLSINHDWAKRLLHRIKTTGLKLLDRFFVDHPVWKAAYDLLSAILIGAGFYLLTVVTGHLQLALAIFLTFTGLALFLGNRRRLTRFTHWLLRKLHLQA